MRKVLGRCRERVILEALRGCPTCVLLSTKSSLAWFGRPRWQVQLNKQRPRSLSAALEMLALTASGLWVFSLSCRSRSEVSRTSYSRWSGHFTDACDQLEARIADNMFIVHEAYCNVRPVGFLKIIDRACMMGALALKIYLKCA
ncbi:hypothetical protein IG631_20200 [Alternaria alternata]|nr:hypothetical protein IG631_20200 [Alternaria alternata]